MPTLITGATGFIGSHIAKKLVERGEEVKVLLRKTSKTLNIDNLNVDRIYGDILDKDSLIKALEGCDTLYHSAGYVSFKKSDYPKMHEVNVIGARNILSAALDVGVKKVLFTSSVAAIGPAKKGELINEETEFSVFNDGIGYLNDKYLAEKEANYFFEKGLPVVILNPSVVLGAGDIYLSSAGSVLWYCKKRFPGYMDGTLNIVDVEDVANGHILAAEKGVTGERYILANENFTVLEYFDLLERVTGITKPKLKIPYHFAFGSAYLVERILGLTFPNYSTMDADSVKLSKYNWHVDVTKSRKVLGLEPTPVEETIRKTVDWFKENDYLQ